MPKYKNVSEKQQIFDGCFRNIIKFVVGLYTY